MGKKKKSILKNIYRFIEKMLGINLAKHTIQFNNFNSLLTRNYRKWARGFIFCRINLGCENKVGAETPPVESHRPRLPR